MKTTEPPERKKKLSPGNICLQHTETWVSFDPSDAFVLEDDHHQIKVKIEIRAWECPFCGESTEYILINGKIVKGCGHHSTVSYAAETECCFKEDCVKAEIEFHNDANA